MNTKAQENSESAATTQSGASPRAAVLANAGNELIFAVVGHAGSGTSTVAQALHQLLLTSANPSYDAEIIKARDVIREWAESKGLQVPAAQADKLESVEALQNLGDQMRAQTDDFSSVARGLIKKIRLTRARKLGVALENQQAVVPDGVARAYVLDSIRHPAEVELLRQVYQDAFILVGVVCEEEKRAQRLSETKFRDAGINKVREFMRRDAKAPDPHGQKVADAFHLADFFIDNSIDRFGTDGSPNAEWNINDKLGRLVRILTHSVIVRPETAETAMHQAAAAAMRSACLSRQVGAALTDKHGNLIATGSNEVPRAGGGVYGEGYEDGAPDHRCAFRKLAPGKVPFCSNTTEQNLLVERLIEGTPELASANPIRKLALKSDLRKSGIGDLIEFSRAVHAEMDALLSAGREGISTLGCRLYVTTFPCHYCARHIVSAGIDEVQFIEPYPKSRAGGLHGDAITQDVVGWTPPSQGGKQVLFRPFVGVAPRLYRRAFLKNRDLKNDQNGDMSFQRPKWGTAWHLRTVGYVEIEARLAKEG